VTDETQADRILYWEGLLNDRPKASESIFRLSKEPVVVADKNAAFNLVAWCLELAPCARPQSMDEVLRHRFFSGSRVQGKVLVVSTPEWGFNLDSGMYDCPVMAQLNEINRQTDGQVVVAYDWVGSSSSDLQIADKELLRKDAELWDAVSKLSAEWTGLLKAGRNDEADALVTDVLSPTIKATRWWASYRGQVKGCIRQVAQAVGALAIVVRIDGGASCLVGRVEYRALSRIGCTYAGPITRVEALEIPKLIDEVRADLRDPKMGMLDPQIELYGYETMAELERALPAHLRALASKLANCEPAAMQCPQCDDESVWGSGVNFELLQ
jgi:hypothetical protein